MICDLCNSTPVAYTITAAYPLHDAVHPTWATYPAPMYRTCRGCLTAALDADRSHAGATPGYLVRGMQ